MDDFKVYTKDVARKVHSKIPAQLAKYTATNVEALEAWIIRKSDSKDFPSIDALFENEISVDNAAEKFLSVMMPQLFAQAGAM